MKKRKVIIGIDISSIPYGTGVSNYTLNLVTHLLKTDHKNTYKLFFSSLRLPLPSDIKKLSRLSNVKIYHYRFPLSSLEFIWNRLHLFPIELFIGKCDVFHTSDWTQPPTIRAKTITTIHDLVPFLYPQWQHPKITQTHRRKLYWAAQECRHFICVSQNTQNDFLKLFPKISPKLTSVVYEAAENKYDRFLKLPPTVKKKNIDIIRRQYGLNRFLLAQGTREPRKNLDRLIQAFCLFKQKNPQSKIELAITGKYGWGKDIRTKDNCIKTLGYIPERNLVALHAAAICLLYPSLYEGFGLPVLKSMKVGTPVITSATSSIPEITGASAILVDPMSVDNIYQAIDKIIKSAALRSRLSRLGISQATKFSWTKTAKETLNLYQSLC